MESQLGSCSVNSGEVTGQPTGRHRNQEPGGEMSDFLSTTFHAAKNQWLPAGRIRQPRASRSWPGGKTTSVMMLITPRPPATSRSSKHLPYPLWLQLAAVSQTPCEISTLDESRPFCSVISRCPWQTELSTDVRINFRSMTTWRRNFLSKVS